MTARTWSEGDPQPEDLTAIVDHFDVTWLYQEDDDGLGGTWLWFEQRVTHHTREDGQPGMVTGFSFSDWGNLLADYGPVREATEDEATSLTVVYA